MTMRVKIGDTWHEVTATSPICVELTLADRRNISAMLPEATKYAVFAGDDVRDAAVKRDWMEG
jgi:hypothetical protein